MEHISIERKTLRWYDVPERILYLPYTYWSWLHTLTEEELIAEVLNGPCRGWPADRLCHTDCIRLSELLEPNYRRRLFFRTVPPYLWTRHYKIESVIEDWRDHMHLYIGRTDDLVIRLEKAAYHYRDLITLLSNLWWRCRPYILTRVERYLDFHVPAGGRLYHADPAETDLKAATQALAQYMEENEPWWDIVPIAETETGPAKTITSDAIMSTKDVTQSDPAVTPSTAVAEIAAEPDRLVQPAATQTQTAPTLSKTAQHVPQSPGTLRSGRTTVSSIEKAVASRLSLENPPVPPYTPVQSDITFVCRPPAGYALAPALSSVPGVQGRETLLGRRGWSTTFTPSGSEGQKRARLEHSVKIEPGTTRTDGDDDSLNSDDDDPLDSIGENAVTD